MTQHPERAADYLDHILDAIERSLAYARRAETFEEFEQDLLLQDGIVRNIGVIGEAAVQLEKVAPDLIEAHPDAPWRDTQTMRHKLVHDYFDIDLAIVWDTVQEDLPPLMGQIRHIRSSLANEN